MLPLLMLPTLCACSDDEATTKPVIKGDTKEVTVGYEAASTRLTVTATEGYDSTIEQEYAQWLSAEMQTLRQRAIGMFYRTGSNEPYWK